MSSFIRSITRSSRIAVIPFLLVFATAATFGSGGLQVETRVYSATCCSFGPVVADFNGDGKMDFATLGGAIVLGNGDGTFRAPTQFQTPSGYHASSVAIGDFNGDRKTDLVFTDQAGDVWVLLGNGDGTFQPAIITTSIATRLGSFLSPLMVADVNGDGKLDVLVPIDNQIYAYLGNGDGTFHAGPTTAVAPQASGNAADEFVLADVNGDGKLDLVYRTATSSQVVIGVQLGKGDGSFGTVVEYPASGARSLTIGDFNADGKIDIAVAGADNNPGYVGTLLGNGDGTFRPLVESAQATPSTALAVADIDGDGKIDLIAGYPGSIRVARGNGDGTFQAFDIVQQAAGSATLVADFNGDGAPDVLDYPTFGGVPFIGVILNCRNGCTSMSVSTPSLTYGATKVTVTVTPKAGSATPSGNVSLCCDSNNAPLSTAALVNGSATLSPLITAATLFVNYSGDTTYAANVTGAVSLTVVPAPTATTLTAAPQSVAPGQSVTLKASVAVTNGANLTPTGSVTLMDGSASIAIVPLDATGSASYTSSAFTTGHHSLTWAYGGASPYYAASTSAAYDLAVGTPDFTVGPPTNGTTSQTVTAGQTATYGLSLAPQAGFTGTVQLSCSGAPAGASCAVTPSSVNVNGTSATPFTVSVTTAARSGTLMSGSVWPRPSGPMGWMIALLFAGMFSAWFAADRNALAKIPTQAKRGLGWGARGILFVVAFAMMTIVGCGGGGSSAPKTPVQTGTPTGTYTIVVSAASGSTTHTQNLTLTVN